MAQPPVPPTLLEHLARLNILRKRRLLLQREFGVASPDEKRELDKEIGTLTNEIDKLKDIISNYGLGA